MNRSHPRYFVPFAALGLWLVAGGARLAAQDVSRDKPVELPAYTVIDTRELPPPEQWYYARIAGFEVLSNASEKSTKRLVGDFQRFYQALSLVWPGVQQKTAVPTSLIICGRGSQFDLFVPEGAKRSERAMASQTLRQSEQSAIVIDFETKVLNLSTPEGLAAAGATAAAMTEDSVGVGAGGDPGFAVDAYRQLYREYIRFLLSGVQPRGPRGSRRASPRSSWRWR